MKFYQWKKSESNLTNKMLESIEEKFSELNIEEAELLVIAKVKLTDKINTTEIKEYDGVKYAKLFFP
jgi:hypothetical protein